MWEDSALNWRTIGWYKSGKSLCQGLGCNISYNHSLRHLLNLREFLGRSIMAAAWLMFHRLIAVCQEKCVIWSIYLLGCEHRAANIFPWTVRCVICLASWLMIERSRKDRPRLMMWLWGVVFAESTLLVVCVCARDTCQKMSTLGESNIHQVNSLWLSLAIRYTIRKKGRVQGWIQNSWGKS